MMNTNCAIRMYMSTMMAYSTSAVMSPIPSSPTAMRAPLVQ